MSPNMSTVMTKKTRQSVTLRIRRHDPATEDEPTYVDYVVPLGDRMTVLDALFQVVWYQDGSLSFRCACRAGMCGSCGMIVDGGEVLACRTQLAPLGPVVTVEPLRNLPVLKDLAVDLEPFFEKYRAVTPYLVPREDLTEPALIPAGSPLRDLVDDHLDCISCGLCYSACSVVAFDPSYLGPAALNRAYCLVGDSRDAARDERLDRVEGQHGVHRCHSLFECTQVCPKNLAPTRAIVKLKRMTGRRKLKRMLGRLLP
jgi:succinate dehydrogenase/fumarate reductase iron-sulfur protein